MTQFQALVMKMIPDVKILLLYHWTPARQHLLFPTIQEINILNHLNLRMIQNYRNTLLLESATSVEPNNILDLIVLTTMESTNP